MSEENYELFGGLPPHEHTSTSLAAAIAIEPVVGRLQRAVLIAIRRGGTAGMTDDELERYLQLRHQTVSARRRELVLKALVFDSGKTRKTSSGRQATIWVAR